MILASNLIHFQSESNLNFTKKKNVNFSQMSNRKEKN